ncbi:MAG TPA: hypothetical protein VFM00_04550, partial [Candidatus Eisenbacteria bacterium]|nr:hypothetical protein [Candidatus Eisenbacteria bacterium]
MNLRRQITELVKLMREEDLAEVEVRRWFSTIRIRRPGGEMVAASAPAREAHTAAPPAAAEAAPDESNREQALSMLAEALRATGNTREAAGLHREILARLDSSGFLGA